MSRPSPITALYGMAIRLLRPVYRLRASIGKTIRTTRIRFTAAEAKGALHVGGRCRVKRVTRLGRNVSMNGLDVVGSGPVTIGDSFHSGPGCLLITQNHDFDHGDAVPYDKTYIKDPISIFDNVWLGARVIILSGVTIGEGAIIQAGSVVVSDVPPCAIAGGHPVKVFRMRDVEHYDRLKAEGSFH